MAEEGEVIQETSTAEATPSNSLVLPSNNARCVYIAWSFFGPRPFTITELARKIKRYNLWYHSTLETKAEAMIIVDGGEDAQRLLTTMMSAQKESGLFVEDPSMANACQLIDEKVKTYLNAFSFPEATEWLQQIGRGTSIVIPSARLRGKAFTAGGSSAANLTERSVSPPTVPPTATTKIPSTPEQDARVTRAATKPTNRISPFSRTKIIPAIVYKLHFNRGAAKGPVHDTIGGYLRDALTMEEGATFIEPSESQS